MAILFGSILAVAGVWYLGANMYNIQDSHMPPGPVSMEQFNASELDKGKAAARDIYNDLIKMNISGKFDSNINEMKSRYELHKAALSYEDQSVLDLYKDSLGNAYMAIKYSADKCPIKISKSWISHNSIDIPEANVTYKNTSKRDIDAVVIWNKCYNNFGDYLGTEHGISQNILKAGHSTSSNWDLNLYELTTKVHSEVYKVHFKDGTDWINQNID